MRWSKVTRVCANLLGVALLGLTGTAFGGEIFQYVSGGSSLPLDLDWFQVVLGSLPAVSGASSGVSIPFVPDIYSYLSSLTLPLGATVQSALCTSSLDCWVGITLPSISGLDLDFISGLGYVLSGIDYVSIPFSGSIGSSIIVTSTPEPSSLVLLISAVAGGSFLHQRWRIRRRAKAMAATQPAAKN